MQLRILGDRFGLDEGAFRFVDETLTELRISESGPVTDQLVGERAADARDDQVEDGVLQDRSVADFQEVADVGRVAAGPGPGERHVAGPARDLDKLLAGLVGVGRPVAGVVIGQECGECLVVHRLAPDQVDVGVADDRGGEAVLDAGQGEPSLDCVRRPGFRVDQELYNTNLSPSAELQVGRPGRAPRMRKIRLKKAGDDRLAARFTEDLNDSQRAAATAPDGYNLILAGPGSGKTRVITYRVAYLIARGVPPSRSCSSPSRDARPARWSAGSRR